MLSILLACAAHVTLNPNEGALSGGYFHTTIRVPHGAPGLHTTRLVVTVPRGILVAKPEVPDDWEGSVTERTLSEDEQYFSHGRLVTTAPQSIELEAKTFADGVHDDHLLNIDVQLKIGCVFADPSTNTQWNGAYTTWWTVRQECEDEGGNQKVFEWAGVQSDAEDGSSPAWTALPEGEYPAPYLYVEPGTACSMDHSGEAMVGGLRWFGVHVPEEVVAIGADAGIVVRVDDQEPDHTTLAAIIMSSVATTLSVATAVAICTISIVRLKNKKRFTEQLLGLTECQCKSATFSHNQI